MSLEWGENIFRNLYPLISDLYDNDAVIEKSVSEIKLDETVGLQVEQKLRKHFVPSFFNQNLYTKNSLKGRVSEILFFICEKMQIDKVMTCFNQNSRLVSVVLKAERCWLAELLTQYDKARSAQDEEKVKSIANRFVYVIKNKDEKTLSNSEIQNRLNKLVALTSIFYETHHKSHKDVTGRNAYGYFRMIFNNSVKS